MPSRSVRVRVHRGHLEPLERLDLEEGSEITVTVEVPAATKRPQPVAVAFDTYPLGAVQPLTRCEIYDDAD